MMEVRTSRYFATPLQVDRIQSRADAVHFSGVTDMADQPGLIVRFDPVGDDFTPWFGRFNPGYPNAYAASTIVALMPGEDHALVVSGGQGYVLNVPKRREWLALQRPFPITFAQGVEPYGFAVVADMTSVTALRADSVVWSALDLGDGEVIVDRITESLLVGRGWHAASQEMRPFVLDLRTGAPREDAS